MVYYAMLGGGGLAMGADPELAPANILTTTVLLSHIFVRVIISKSITEENRDLLDDIKKSGLQSIYQILNIKS